MHETATAAVASCVAAVTLNLLDGAFMHETQKYSPTPWIVPEGGLPTAEAIRKEFPDGQRFPPGMPLGGWGSGPEGLAEAVTALTEWATSLTTGGGSFSLVKSGKREPATIKGKKGSRKSLQCSCRGRKKTCCEP